MLYRKSNIVRSLIKQFFKNHEVNLVAFALNNIFSTEKFWKAFGE